MREYSLIVKSNPVYWVCGGSSSYMSQKQMENMGFKISSVFKYVGCVFSKALLLCCSLTIG